MAWYASGLGFSISLIRYITYLASMLKDGRLGGGLAQKQMAPLSIHQGFSMSDKFFFKGRQDARQHHTAHGGFKTNASQKSGSKKFPLQLVVTSEDRKQEVEALVARSEEHTSELQSRPHLVCRLLLEKKNKYT